MACNRRAAVLDVDAEDGILNAGVGRGVRPAKAGMLLVARARRISKYKLSGMYRQETEDRSYARACFFK